MESKLLVLWRDSSPEKKSESTANGVIVGSSLAKCTMSPVFSTGVLAERPPSRAGEEESTTDDFDPTRRICTTKPQSQISPSLAFKRFWLGIMSRYFLLRLCSGTSMSQPAQIIGIASHNDRI